MYGYQMAAALVRRELTVQAKLAGDGRSQVLNIPCVLGPVGGGKTSMAQVEALFWELMLCVFNSGENSDATDLSGVPVPTMVRNLLNTVNDPTASKGDQEEARGLYMQWVLNKYASLACIQPVFLFFDDLDKAPPPVQSALLGILANRMFRDQRIHPGSLIMCAGNRVEDDEYANAISESLRTRMTIIEMSPDLLSLQKYADETGEIHKTVMGFLQYKTEFVHQWKEGVNRFPTPRGWWEVSRQFEAYPDPFEDVFKNGTKDNWKHIVSRKCGDHVGNDFWAWYKIISRVKPKEILTTGNIPAMTDDEGNPADHRMVQYAAIFAVAQTLVQKVEKSYVGLTKFVDKLSPEMRVAFVVQLPLKTRSKISTTFTDAADIMMSDIVRTSDNKAVLRPQPTTAP